MDGLDYTVGDVTDDRDTKESTPNRDFERLILVANIFSLNSN